MIIRTDAQSGRFFISYTHLASAVDAIRNVPLRFPEYAAPNLRYTYGQDICALPKFPSEMTWNSVSGASAADEVDGTGADAEVASEDSAVDPADSDPTPEEQHSDQTEEDHQDGKDGGLSNSTADDDNYVYSGSRRRKRRDDVYMEAVHPVLRNGLQMDVDVGRLSRAGRKFMKKSLRERMKSRREERVKNSLGIRGVSRAVTVSRD